MPLLVRAIRSLDVPGSVEIAATPEQRWQAYAEEGAVSKECVQVEYFPEENPANGYREPLRHVAIRIRQKLGELFADGNAVKYFAVVTNLWDWAPKKLLSWHREKAGSIEAAHDVIRNELAGGVLPWSRFGSNAAWFRLAVLTYNVLTAMKRLALPSELLTARPRRLRFPITLYRLRTAHFSLQGTSNPLFPALKSHRI